MVRYFYKGTDPNQLDADQLENLLMHIKSIRNLEQGKPAEGTWFERAAMEGSVRTVIGAKK